MVLARLVVDGGAAAETFSAAERHKIAVGLILFSGITMAGMMTALKLASGQMSLWQVMVIRAGLAALIILPIFRLARIPILPTSGGLIRLYALRVALAAGGITCWIYSIAYLPLGVASALSFSKGLFVLWLAALFLGERITALKVLTTLVGFCGVLLVLEPSGGGSVTAGVAGILGALFGALLTVVIKTMSATEPTIRMMFFPLIGITVLFAVPAIATWQPLDLSSTGLIAAMVVLGMLSQWCFISAYRLGEVSALAPVEYSRLIMAVIAGYVAFGEIPTAFGIAGMMLIVAASYAVLRHGAAPPIDQDKA